MKFSEALEQYLFAREVYDKLANCLPAVRCAAERKLAKAAARLDELVAGTPPPAPIPAPPTESVYATPATGRWLDTK